MYIITRDKKIIRPIILFILILIIVSFVSSIEANNLLEIKSTQYNIILISIDTLRADHLSCYGYFRNTSPNIGKLAEEGILFEQAISQSGATLPSHASIFTSQYPFVHGADTIATISLLNDSKVTLAEILKIYGYKTASFTGGGHLKKIYGIAQGFDIYYDEGDWNSPLGSFNNTVSLAINWLKENKDDKFFLFLHGYDVHVPYYYPVPYENMFDHDYKGIVDEMSLTWEGLTKVYKNIYLKDNGEIIKLTQKDIKHIIAHYDGGIRYADEKIGEFLQEIKKLRILDNTIIILLSDHGEDLFEHGHIGKHVGPYEEIIRVPLIIRHPQIMKKNKKIDIQVQLIDVMPTILDFLNIPIDNGKIQGKSLIPLIENNAGHNFNEFVYSRCGAQGVVRSKRWKLIGKFELYDLRNDPGEQHNIIDKYPVITLDYLHRLFNWIIDNEKLKAREINCIKTETDKIIIKSNGYW